MSNSLTSLQRLSDVAEIRTGYALKDGVVFGASSGNTCVVQIRDVQIGEFGDHDVPSSVNLSPLHMSDYLAAGDVVIPGRGLRYTAAVYQGGTRPVLAISPLFVLTPLPMIDPVYLMWFLNQTPAQSQLERARTGTNIPMISKTALASIQIALPPLREQRHIADYFRAALAERAHHQRLLQLRDQEMQHLSHVLMKKASRE